SVFVDENEITDLQGGHHGCRGNLKGLHHEGAQHQHQQQHGKKRRGVLDIKRRGSVPPPSRQHQLVQQPHDTADQRQHHQYQWKIQIHISCPSSAPPGRLPGEFLRCPPASCAFCRLFAFRGVFSCGTHRRRSTWRSHSCAMP